MAELSKDVMDKVFEAIEIAKHFGDDTGKRSGNE